MPGEDAKLEVEDNGIPASSIWRERLHAMIIGLFGLSHGACGSGMNIIVVIYVTQTYLSGEKDWSLDLITILSNVFLGKTIASVFGSFAVKKLSTKLSHITHMIFNIVGLVSFMFVILLDKPLIFLFIAMFGFGYNMGGSACVDQYLRQLATSPNSAARLGSMFIYGFQTGVNLVPLATATIYQTLDMTAAFMFHCSFAVIQILCFVTYLSFRPHSEASNNDKTEPTKDLGHIMPKSIVKLSNLNMVFFFGFYTIYIICPRILSAEGMQPSIVTMIAGIGAIIGLLIGKLLNDPFHTMPLVHFPVPHIIMLTLIAVCTLLVSFETKICAALALFILSATSSIWNLLGTSARLEMVPSQIAKNAAAQWGIRMFQGGLLGSFLLNFLDVFGVQIYFICLCIYIAWETLIAYRFSRDHSKDIMQSPVAFCFKLLDETSQHEFSRYLFESYWNQKDGVTLDDLCESIVKRLDTKGKHTLFLEDNIAYLKSEGFGSLDYFVAERMLIYLSIEEVNAKTFLTLLWQKLVESGKPNAENLTRLFTKYGSKATLEEVFTWCKMNAEDKVLTHSDFVHFSTTHVDLLPAMKGNLAYLERVIAEWCLAWTVTDENVKPPPEFDFVTNTEEIKRRRSLNNRV